MSTLARLAAVAVVLCWALSARAQECQGKPDGIACDDANPCTRGDRCWKGTCMSPLALARPAGYANPGVAPFALGDFDSDGDDDMVARKAGSDAALVILLGKGDGLFMPAGEIPLAEDVEPEELVVADFNLDGRPDIASQDDDTASLVLIHLGDGYGGFVPAGPGIPVGSHARALVAGDLNEDDRIDLVSLREGHPGTATVLLGDGAGGFSARPPIPAGDSPTAAAVADLNLDDKLDLAVANRISAGKVTILLGDGLGGLAPGPNSPIDAAEGPGSVAAGDYDRDGDEDLVVANASFGLTKVTLLRNDGTGAFTRWTSPSVRQEATSAAFADMDLDGQLDLVIGCALQVEVRLGNGTGFFREAYGSPLDVSGDDAEVAIADLDRDGRPDIIAASTRSQPLEIAVFTNPGDWQPCPSADGCERSVCDRATGGCVDKIPGHRSRCDDHDFCTTNDSCRLDACVGAPVGCTVLVACHVAGTCDPIRGCVDVAVPDGLPCDDLDACSHVDACIEGACVGSDIVTCPDSGGCLSGFCSPETGTCSLVARPDGTTCDDGAACTAGDACQEGSCQSGLAFTGPVGGTIPIPGDPGPTVVADLDSDGNVDLAVVSTSRLNLLTGDGTGRFARMDGSPITLPSGPTAIAAADFDLDGTVDLAVTSRSSSSAWLSVFLNGSSGLAHAPGSPLVAFEGASSVLAGDFNVDGKPDIAYLYSFEGVVLLLGNGKGRFTLHERTFTVTGHNVFSATVADLDLDGVPDLLLAGDGPTRSIRVFYSFGSLSFPPFSDLSPPGGSGEVLVGDLDLDGWPDIVSLGGASVSVLLANGGGGFTTAPGSPLVTITSPGSLVDFNLDGRLDLVITGRSSRDVRVFLGDGTGRLTEAASSPIADHDASRVVASDLNADGSPDVVVASRNLDLVAIHLSSPVFSANGTSCSDGNACTVGDTCGHGTCGAGFARSCDDNNPCTDDACDTATGCAHASNIAPCDDGNLCTAGDRCGPSPGTRPLMESFDAVSAPALPGGWSALVAGTGAPWRTRATGASPPNAIYGDDGDQIADEGLESPAFAIDTPTAVLSFRHRWSFDDAFDCWDGSVLEIKMGDAPYADIVAAGGSFVTGGYTGTIDPNWGNPLGGRPGWCRVSAGYPAYLDASVLLPAAAAGQTVRLRWRLGSDVSVRAVGQDVDSIAVVDGEAEHVCNGGAPLTCDDGNSCTLDTCSPSEGCVFSDVCTDVPRRIETTFSFGRSRSVARWD